MKIFKFKTIILFSTMVLGQIAIFSLGNTYGYAKAKAEIPEPKTIQLPGKTITKIVEPKGTVISVTIEDLQKYVTKLAPHWSTKMRNHFLEVVAKASDKYGISPLVFVSMASVESSYRPQITHTLAKGARERAVGLMGIMPKMWLPELRKAGIADTKYDLFTIEASVMASAYILDVNRKKPLKKGVTNPMESALRRYFGDNYKSYTDKIASNIGAIIFSKVYK